MEIYIDFDGTISPRHFPAKLDIPPTIDCINTIKKLKEDGHTIVIWSCRANPSIIGIRESDEATIEMLEYLKKHSIPFDRIDKDKPLYSILICDRAISAKDGDWNRILKDFKQIISTELLK